jgi:hypothetical protein
MARSSSPFEMGKAYARESLASDHFDYWVSEQLAEALRDPQSHWQIENKADALRAAGNMLQQLGWDMDRGFSNEVASLSSEDRRRWREGRDAVLKSQATRNRLAGRILREDKELRKHIAGSPKRSRKNLVTRFVTKVGRSLKKAFR